VKAGPKCAVEGSPLPFRSRLGGGRRFATFCREYVAVPKGKGALKALRLRPWQVELVGTVLDPDPPKSLAGWMLPAAGQIRAGGRAGPIRRDVGRGG
jgi:hypothetical protein